jgi:glyoxalase family protein
MMQLEGIHHITAITADALQNLRFYTDVLGLRLIAKSVNQDEGDPTYHLFYGSEDAAPGSELTFFEYPGVARGRPGAGMVHRITWRVASTEALAFWEARLRTAHVECERAGTRLRFCDPEGLGLELAVVETTDEPLIAAHPDIPAECGLQGFHAVHAFAWRPERSTPFFERTLGFGRLGAGEWEARGPRRGARYLCEPAPEQRGMQGAGTVHHVAWAAASNEEHAAWRDRVIEGGAHPSPVIDRYYFQSIYLREPNGVLFEIASPGPGFAHDTPLERLGEEISLPPWFQPRRAEIETRLTPLPNPRAGWTARRAAPG